jgi:hypothetical protein
MSLQPEAGTLLGFGDFKKNLYICKNKKANPNEFAFLISYLILPIHMLCYYSSAFFFFANKNIPRHSDVCYEKV